MSSAAQAKNFENADVDVFPPLFLILKPLCPLFFLAPFFIIHYNQVQYAQKNARETVIAICFGEIIWGKLKSWKRPHSYEPGMFDSRKKRKSINV